MRRTKSIHAVLVAAATFLWVGATTAAETHQHDAPPKPAAPQTRPAPDGQSKPVISAEDLMKAMEDMPAHDHDTCCTLAGSKTKSKEHNH